ncbi:MAG: hypothetical protein Q8Q30_02075 [Candidatus Woesebacteria bacterium]|nr:hypothetical protein [Candidatus Woesebacteria bacterium]
MSKEHNSFWETSPEYAPDLSKPVQLSISPFSTGEYTFWDWADNWMDVSTIEEAQKLLESGKIEVTSIVSDYPIEGEFKKLLEDREIHYLDIGTEILLDDLSESGSEYIQ